IITTTNKAKENTSNNNLKTKPIKIYPTNIKNNQKNKIGRNSKINHTAIHSIWGVDTVQKLRGTGSGEVVI
ncbi:hypothetical protein ACQP3D_25785, partial [Escherichia coli]